MKKIYFVIKDRAQQFIHQDEAVTAMEYGLIAAATAVAIIVALASIKTTLGAIFQSVAAAL